MDFFSAFEAVLSRAGLKTTASRQTALGVSDEYVRKIFQGKAVPSDDVIYRALEKAGADPETRTKIMFLAAKERAPGGARDFWTFMAERSDKVLNAAASKVQEPETQYVVSPDAVVWIPVYRSVRGGAGDTGIEHDEAPIDHVVFPANYMRSGAFGLLVEGDSMNAAPSNISPGSYAVFVPINGDSVNGKVCCICVKGWSQCAVKRVFPEPDGSVVLKSDNPAFPPIRLDPNAQPFKIIGIFKGAWLPGDGKPVKA